MEENRDWKTFWTTLDITPFITKEDLWDYILYEFSDMNVLQTNHKHFQRAVELFFKHWKPQLDELYKTLNYQYDPLRDYSMTHHKDVDDHETIDRDIESKYTEQSTDITAVSAFNDLGPTGDNDGFHNRNRITHDGSGTTTTSDDTIRQENIGEDYIEDGNRKYSFAELIKQQRETVQFDILRWLMSKWAGEIMVAVW